MRFNHGSCRWDAKQPKISLVDFTELQGFKDGEVTHNCGMFWSIHPSLQWRSQDPMCEGSWLCFDKRSSKTCTLIYALKVKMNLSLEVSPLAKLQNPLAKTLTKTHGQQRNNQGKMPFPAHFQIQEDLWSMLGTDMFLWWFSCHTRV